MTKDDLKNCGLCGGSVARIESDLPVTIGRRRVSVRGTFATCNQCGESFLAPGEMDAVLRSASDQIRDEEGLLGPHAIKAIRESLGLSQVAFERLLGVGPKTVVRWERGTVFQNGATDTLLRVVQFVPEAASFLKALRLEPATGAPARDVQTAARESTFARYTYRAFMPAAYAGMSESPATTAPASTHTFRMPREAHTVKGEKVA
jgi:HTH-type transcriptional regulator/antitoxin MqsA